MNIRVNPNQFPAVLIFKGKHGDEHYYVDSENSFYAAFDHQFAQREQAGGWWTAEEIADFDNKNRGMVGYDKKRCSLFLFERRDYEYEGFEVEKLIVLNPKPVYRSQVKAGVEFP